MIDICLATYNGEEFLCEQMDSILHQTFIDWHLYIRDDGSNDETCSILEEYAKKYIDKITLIKDSKGNIGYTNNFLEIISYTISPYVAFSDQDDIWLPEKLNTLISEMKFLEKKNGIIPIIIHSDFDYLQENKIYKRNKSYDNRLKNNNNTIKILLHQGCLLGCTSMINRSLCNLVKNIPNNKSIGYDIYFLAVSSIVGINIYLPEVLIHHRLHSLNTSSVGRRHSVFVLLNKSIRFKVSSLIPQMLIAKKLIIDFGHLMNSKTYMNLDFISNLNSKSILYRILFVVKNRLISFSLNGLVTFFRFVKKQEV